MIIKNWQKDYEADIQIDSDTNSNSSLAKQLNLVGDNKNVLEFGCATGYFSRMLSDKGCNIVGVEINSGAAKQAEKYCSKVIIADLDFTSLGEILAGQTFDVAVFGDVLEHLRDPWGILESVKDHLNPGGFVVASTPNIAHGAVRLSLLQGKFNYQRYGILDNTHIRFFTKSTIIEMFEKSGYLLDVLDRTKVSILSGCDLLPAFDKDAVSSELIKQLESDEESDTFQFVVRAYPQSEENRYLSICNKHSDLEEKYNTLKEKISMISKENQLIKNSKWWRLRNIFSR
jgi:O-antigen biosynthesis protein